jgi:Tfp pilus assembly protein PilO
MPSDQRKAPAPKKRYEWLRNPTNLRIITTTIVLAAGYALVFSPLSASIDESARKLSAEKKRLEAACEIENLRRQYKSFKDRLPAKTDTNEWVQYILTGVRQFPVNLAGLDPEPIREVGPYKAVALRIDLTGRLPDMNKFLHWLETNERILRVDMLMVQPDLKKDGTLNMRIIMLGIMG